MSDALKTTFYTYTHTRNDTDAVFYVGKGMGKRCHSTGNRNRHWHNIVKKHGYSVHLAMTYLTEAEALDHEKFLILCFKDLNIPLCNMTDGGDGVSGMVYSAESRTKMSASAKGRPPFSAETRAKMSTAAKGRNTGRVHSAESRANMSAAHKGCVVSAETRAKLRTALKGRVFSAESRAKMSTAAKARKKQQNLIRSAA